MADLSAADLARLSAALEAISPKAPSAMPDERRSSFLGDVVLRKGLGQGLLFGAGDEAAAGVRSLLGSESYDAALADERARLRQVEAERPIASTVAELGGAIAPALVAGPLGLAGTAARAGAAGGRTVAGALGRGALAGAAGGGLQGFAEGEGGLGPRLDNALADGLLGAGMGGALGGAAGVAGAAMRRAGAGPETRGADAVLRSLDADRLTPEQVAQDYAARQVAGAKPELVSDMLPNSNTAGLFETSMNRPSDARAAVADALDRRMANQGDRLADDHTTALGGQQRSAHQALEDWSAQRQADAAPLYDRVRQFGPINDAEVNQMLLRLPDRVFGQASDFARLAGSDPERLIARNRAGDRGLARIPTATDLDHVVQALGDEIGSAQRAGNNQLARSLTQAKAGLTGRLDDIIVDPNTGERVYQMARAAWAGPSALRDAAEEGMQAFNRHPQAIMQHISRLNDSERNAFTIGATQAIREKLGKIRDGRDASGVAGMSDHSRAQLDAILHAVTDDAGQRATLADQLVANVRRENQIARTNQAVLGGSQTARRLAAAQADQKGDGLASSIMLDALTGSPGIATGVNLARNVLGTKFRALAQRMTAAGDTARSGEIVRLLGGTDVPSIEQAMAALAARRDQLARAGAVTQPVAPAAAIAGRTAAGFTNEPERR